MKKKLTRVAVKALVPLAKPFEVHDTEIKGFLLRVQPSGVMTYYISYRNNEHKRTRYKIGNSGNLSPVQARDIAERLAGKVANNEDIQAVRKSTRTNAKQAQLKTLEGFINSRYEDWVTTHRKSGTESIKTIKRNFSQFYTRPLSEINPWVIDKWRSDRKKSGTSPSTINRDLAALKSALSKAVEWNIIDTHPLSKMKPLKTDTKINIRYLLDDEEKTLRKALSERDKNLIDDRTKGNEWRKQRKYTLREDLEGYTYADHLTPMTLLTLNTGLRRGEMFDLSWKDIDLNSKILTIHGETAKSGDTRHIPLNKDASELLIQWKKQTSNTGLIFPNKKGERFHTIKTSWKSLLDKAKITGFRWHDLRHDFASKLVMAGAPLNTVRELLGHSDIKTTLRYAHLAPEHKAEAVNLLNQSNT